MAFDSKAQRQIMGRFATGVALVTSVQEGVPFGMTVNSLTSLSLDPPLVLIAVNCENSMHKVLSESRCFALSLLTVEQESIARHFATNGPKDFSPLSIAVAETGSPLLADSLGHIDCTVEDIVSGGDHDIFVGRCVAGELRDGEPLVFYNGLFTQLPPGVFAADEDSDQYLLEDTFGFYGSI